MTRNMSTQLSDYFDHVDETQGAIDVMELMTADHASLVPAPRPQRPTPMRRGIVVAVVSAVIVLLLAIPLLLTLGDDELPPATTPPTTSAPPPTTTATPPTSGAAERSPSADRGPVVAELPAFTVAGWTWVESNLPHEMPVARLADGTWVSFDDGWECCDTAPTDDPIETVYLSSDGVEWEPVTFDALVDSYGTFRVQGPPYYFVEIDGARGSESVWWLTADGRGIEPVTAISGLSLAAVGDTVVSLPPGCPYSGDLSVSLDGGRSASTVDGLPGDGEISLGDLQRYLRSQFGAEYSGLDCSAPRTYGHSLFTLRGDFYALDHPTPEEQPVLWRSEDGQSWERIGATSGYGADNEIGGRSRYVDLGHAVLAVVPEPADDKAWIPARYLLSQDGLTWSPVEVPVPVAGNQPTSRPSISPGAAADSSWVHLSLDYFDNRSMDVVGLAQTNGIAWYRIDPPPGAATRSFGGAIWAADPSPEGTTMWIAVPPDE